MRILSMAALLSLVACVEAGKSVSAYTLAPGETITLRVPSNTPRYIGFQLMESAAFTRDCPMMTDFAGDPERACGTLSQPDAEGPFGPYHGAHGVGTNFDPIDGDIIITLTNNAPDQARFEVTVDRPL